MLASIIYNHGKFCDDFKSTLKLGAYINRIQNAVMLKVIARDIDVKLSNSNRCDDNALIYINEAVDRKSVV